MKSIKLFMLFIVGILIISTSCDKNDVLKNETVFLRDKSLAEIKAAVSGNWKIHYSFGGITGNTKTTMTNSYFRVLANDSIYLTFNNSLYASDRAIFQQVNTTFGYTAYTMDFESINGNPKSWIVDYTIGDTLVLDDNYINGSAYFMTKIP